MEKFTSDNEQMKIRTLANDFCISYSLARDLLILAGGDEDIVRQASSESDRLESVKCKIINLRMSKLEKGAHDEQEAEEEGTRIS